MELASSYISSPVSYGAELRSFLAINSIFSCLTTIFNEKGSILWISSQFAPVSIDKCSFISCRTTQNYCGAVYICTNSNSSFSQTCIVSCSAKKQHVGLVHSRLISFNRCCVISSSDFADSGPTTLEFHALETQTINDFNSSMNIATVSPAFSSIGGRKLSMQYSTIENNTATVDWIMINKGNDCTTYQTINFIKNFVNNDKGVILWHRNNGSILNSNFIGSKNYFSFLESSPESCYVFRCNSDISLSGKNVIVSGCATTKSVPPMTNYKFSLYCLKPEFCKTTDRKEFKESQLINNSVCFTISECLFQEIYDKDTCAVSVVNYLCSFNLLKCLFVDCRTNSRADALYLNINVGRIIIKSTCFDNGNCYNNGEYSNTTSLFSIY